MEIKEVEKLLSISRSNVRFYEKQGLISPERRKNNYRDYTEEDVLALKKIIVLRKMGFTVEEILLIQEDKLSFPEAVQKAQSRLESEMEQLNGALKIIKQVSKENTSFNDIDVGKYWENIYQAEKLGERFIDVCKDYLKVELDTFDLMWKYVFFHDFKKSRKKHGVVKASIILLLICVVRGISGVLFWHESFWNGFLYPLSLTLMASVITIPLFILSKKAPKIASIICTFFLVLIILFFVGIVLFIIGAIIYSVII